MVTYVRYLTLGITPKLAQIDWGKSQKSFVTIAGLRAET
jgi:hypothetical protein